MVYQCQMCGGSVQIDRKEGILICDYCGTKQPLELFTTESERLLSESGNAFLKKGEYDKAAGVFNQLLAICPNNPQIHWKLLLCKYGVSFVKDPKLGSYIPTCNRTHYESVFQNEHYIAATELSASEELEYYKETAKILEGIQKATLEIIKKEKPFDVFISYKETTPTGSRTKDSIEAQKLYNLLTEAGYKVFLSRITLEKKIGTEYEPYIYAALSSSKVMITVSSSRENLESPWVQNEWSRFMTMRQNDANKNLIPVYFDMEKEQLPDAFALLPAQDLRKDGFEQELVRGIKKLIPQPITKQERRKRMLIASGGIVAVCALVAVILLTVLLPAKKYENAIACFNNGQYAEAVVLFESLGNYKDAHERLAQAERENKYFNTYQEAISSFEAGNCEQAITLFESLGDYRDSATKLVEAREQGIPYFAAMDLYRAEKYPQAAWAFAELGDYKDSQQLKLTCESNWRKSIGSVTANGEYINKDGKVVLADSTTLPTNEHGRAESLGEGGCVVYEDGYLSSKNFPQQTGIIKAYSDFNGEGVALLSNGKMIYSDGTSDWNDWLSEVEEWDQIVDFVCIRNCGDGTMAGLLSYSLGLVVGIREDGTLCYTSYTCPSFNSTIYAEMRTLENILNEVSNVKSISCSLKSGDEIVYNYSPPCYTLAICTTDGNVFYTSESFEKRTEIKDGDIVDVNVSATGDVVWLKRNGDLINSNNKTVLQEVIYLKDGIAVTRTGTPYYVYDSRPSKLTEDDLYFKAFENLNK